jgi:RNA polymerase sigma factor (sigma-70 family)
VRRAADGDQVAFAAIYERFNAPLYRYCYSVLGSEEDARDALQITMTKAWGALQTRPPDQLKPWLYRIAHHAAIDLVRSRRDHHELTDAHEAVGLSAGHELEARDRLRELVDDLRRLTLRQRGALVMRELGGLSCAEIATALEISPGGVKQAIFEARSSLASFADGRAADCEQIRRSLSTADRRQLRSRGLRSHLHDCPGCRSFEAAIGERRHYLGGIVPVLPAAAAGSVLEGILGSGGAGSTSGLLGVAAAPTTAAAVAVKAIAVVAVTAAVGVGTVEAGRAMGGSSTPEHVSAEMASDTSRSDTSGGRSAADGGRPDHRLSSEDSRTRRGTRAPASSPRGAAGADSSEAPGGDTAELPPNGAPASGAPPTAPQAGQAPPLPAPATDQPGPPSSTPKPPVEIPQPPATAPVPSEPAPSAPTTPAPAPPVTLPDDPRAGAGRP